jgi:D-psicose/D-tagatose/L-ribulose 3-epimerase
MSTPIGASTYLWAFPFGNANIDLVTHVAELGFDVFEAAIDDPEIVTGEAIAEATREAGMAVSVCGSFDDTRDVSHEDPVMRRKGIDYLRICTDIAETVGSPHVAGPMFSAEGKARLLSEQDRERQWSWAVESLREAAAYAADHGVRLAIEPLNRFETDFANTVDQGLRLCDRIDRENVGLLLDTFHMNIEEKSIGDAIRRAGDRVFHFHACENDRGAPGTGGIPWDEVFVALRDINYSGHAVIESFTRDSPELTEGARLWRPLAGSSDELATEGLAFLRSRLGAD